MTQSSPPLVIFDTNVLFDYFLGRDGDIQLLAALSGANLRIVVPEFVLFEFRGSMLRELGRMEERLSSLRQLASDLDRADHWKSGVDALRDGSEKVAQDLVALRDRLDPFLSEVCRTFVIEPHTPELHYLGDIRFVQGLPPDRPKRGVQDCRILEAALAIARKDMVHSRPERFFLTKDSDFLKKHDVIAELLGVGVHLVGAAGPIYGKYRT